MKPGFGWLGLLVTALVVALAGCGTSNATGPAVMPVDPVCDILPADVLAELLPPGDYFQTTVTGNKMDNYMLYLSRIHGVDGVCDVTHKAVNGRDAYGGFYLYASGFDGESSDLSRDCHDSLPEPLRVPRVGLLVDSGVCTGPDPGGPWFKAWALYWGGEYSGIVPATNLIRVIMNPRSGVDGAAAAGRLVQIVLDFIDTCYAADHPDANQSPSPGTRPPQCDVPATQPSDSPS